MERYIAEIAGKDSIAAVLSFASDHSGVEIIPTIAITGTEYGDLSSYEKSINFLKYKSEKFQVTMADAVYIQDGELWNRMNARYQYCIYKKFFFYTPCITCHLYAHLLRIPICKKYKARGIITGERKSHSGKLKANQHERTIEVFDNIFQDMDIRFIRPLLEIRDTSMIDSLIDDADIVRHANDVKCVMSGNLREFSLEEEDHIALMDKYLEEYVFPVGRLCTECLNNKENIDMEELDGLLRRILNA